MKIEGFIFPMAMLTRLMGDDPKKKCRYYSCIRIGFRHYLSMKKRRTPEAFCCNLRNIPTSYLWYIAFHFVWIKDMVYAAPIKYPRDISCDVDFCKLVFSGPVIIKHRFFILIFQK
ncbi:unnamed protein product [Schistosoma bovis]|nr:unnamed protein product [Schistosoma bovis]